MYSHFFNWSTLLSPQLNKLNCIILTRITSTSASLPRFRFWFLFFYQTGQEEELEAVMRDTTLIIGGGIRFMALKAPWQCSRCPSGRHMLERGTGFETRRRQCGGKWNVWACIWGEFCSKRAAVRRNREAQTMDHNLHSILNSTSKIMNHISIVKLIKLKLFRKTIFVYCDEKFNLK